MRRITCLCCAVLLVGCAKAKEEANPPADTTAMAPAPVPAPLSLNDVAGTWTVQGTREGSDSMMITYTLEAKADTAGWTIKFANRTQPVALHVLNVAGDSLVVHAGPYESALRKGVMVTTHGVLRMENGKLVGQTTARYKTTAADSVAVIKTEGTRAQ